MSPELFKKIYLNQGLNDEFNLEKSDVYSLGIVFFEFISQMAPNFHPNMQPLTQNETNNLIDTLFENDNHLPEYLKELLKNMLSY